MKKLAMVFGIFSVIVINSVAGAVTCTKTYNGDYWFSCPRAGCNYPSGKNTKYGNFTFVCSDGTQNVAALMMSQGGCGSCTNYNPFA
jgi:hypothetical protein